MDYLSRRTFVKTAKEPNPAWSMSPDRFVYQHAKSLIGWDLAGTGENRGQCVALIQKYMLGVGHTSTWEFEEKPMVDNWRDMLLGTVIGNKTPEGRWPGQAHGNHVCFYLMFGEWEVATHRLLTCLVVEQFVSRMCTQIQVRELTSKGKGPDGRFIDPSNNIDAFFPLKRKS